MTSRRFDRSTPSSIIQSMSYNEAVDVIECWLKESEQYIQLPYYVKQAISLGKCALQEVSNCNELTLTIVFEYVEKDLSKKALFELYETLQEFDSKLYELLIQDTFQESVDWIHPEIIEDKKSSRSINHLKTQLHGYSCYACIIDTLKSNRVNFRILSKEVKKTKSRPWAYAISINNSLVQSENTEYRFYSIDRAIEIVTKSIDVFMGGHNTWKQSQS